MPNMEETLNQIPVEISRDRTKQVMISKTHLDCANNQVKLSNKTSRQCVFAITGGNSVDTTDSKKDSLVLPIFQRFLKN